MEIIYKVNSPDKFSKSEKKIFLELLKKQGQVKSPSLVKIEKSSLICIVSIDNVAIGIGALKNVYKKPFEYAGISELKNDYNLELGYLFVDTDLEKSGTYRGLGIGKNISKYLLENVKEKNVFATTELNSSNVMLHILRNLNFISIGNPFKGELTGKIITLMILNRGK